MKKNTFRNGVVSCGLNTIAIVLVIQLGALQMLFCQEAVGSDDEQPTELKPVIVTGSLIPTAETAEIAPVEVLTAATIEKTGVATLELVAKRQPVAIGAGNFGISRGNGGDGRAEIALRGIPGGTLLLINGRRTANPDLNAIPIGAIERIEILKDGGSSIYGADAVAGVVNIIMKKDFTGTQFDARYANTTDTDVGEQSYSFVTGSATEKASLLVGGSYYKVNSLYSKDREISRPDLTPGSDAYYRNTSPTGNPGRIQTTQVPVGHPLRTGMFYTGAPGTTGASTNDYRLFNPDTDRFPYPLYTPAIRDAERYSFFGNGEYSLYGDNVKFFAESYYTYSYSYNQLAPTPIVFQFNTTPTSPNGIVIPATHPYNVFGVPIDRMRYRPVELGPRTDSNEYDIFRFVSGLRGRVGESTWNYETAVLYTFQDGVNKQGNDISRMGLEKAVNSTDPATAFNPFGNAANTKAALDAIRLNHYTFDKDELFSIDAVVRNGALYELPSGWIGFAVGGAHLQQRGTHEPDATLIFGDVVGFNSDKPFSGSRDIWSAFYQVDIPVLGKDWQIPGVSQFTITHSGRYDQYSDFGDTYNPKVGILWKPLDDQSLAIRASYSESFTAPSFGELYAAEQESYPELRNPVKYSLGYPEYFDQIRTFYSGNPDLEPTTAKNYTAGLVYSPPFIKTLTLTFDWFRVEQKGVPGSVDQFILDENFRTGGPWDPNALYADLIRFDTDTLEYTALYAPTLNLSRRIIEGFDSTINYELRTDSVGTYNWTLAFSYYYRFEQENLPGTGLRDRLGDFVDPSQSFGLGSLPRLKGYTSLFWNYSDFECGATLNYIGSYRDDVASGFDRKIEEQFTLDLQVAYNFVSEKKWLDGTRLVAGVINVTDEPPPLVMGAFADNYDRDTHDLRGRMWYVSMSKKF